MTITYGSFYIREDNDKGESIGICAAVCEGNKMVGFVGDNGSQYEMSGEEVGILTYKDVGEDGFEAEVFENWTHKQ